MRYMAMQRADVFFFAGFIGMIVALVLKSTDILDIPLDMMVFGFTFYMAMLLLFMYLPWGIGKWMSQWIGFGKVKKLELPTHPNIFTVATYNDLPAKGTLGYIYMVQETGRVYRYAGERGYQMLVSHQ